MRILLIFILLVLSLTGLNAQYIEQTRGHNYGVPVVDANSTKKKIKVIDGTAGQVLTKGAGHLVTWATPPTGTDNQQLTLVGNTLTLQNGGTVDLSPYLDNTDDQQITAFSLDASTNVLTITLEGGGTQTVDLSGLSHTGTAGSVFFAGNDGKPTEDNANLFWDSANKRFGIGTTSPTEKLEVNGAVKIGNNGGVSILFPSGRSIRERNSSQNSIMFLDMGDIRIRDGNAFPYGAGLSVGGNKFVVKNNANGFVGIGTSTPSDKLHVVGKLKIENPNSATSIYSVNQGNNEFKIERAGVYPSFLSIYALNNRITQRFSGSFGMQFENLTTGKNIMAIRGDGVRISNTTTDIFPPDAGVIFQVDGKGKFSETVSGADAVNATDFVTKQQLDANGDNLGNHTATQNIDVNSNSLLFDDNFSILDSYTQLRIKIGATSAISVSQTGSVNIPNLDCSLRINRVLATDGSSGNIGDILVAGNSSSAGNIVSWKHLNPTVGSNNTSVFAIMSSSAIYSTALEKGEVGYIENPTTGNITISLPSGLNWIDKQTQSATITLAGHETISFINDDSNSLYRIITRY